MILPLQTFMYVFCARWIRDSRGFTKIDKYSSSSCSLTSPSSINYFLHHCMYLSSSPLEMLWMSMKSSSKIIVDLFLFYCVALVKRDSHVSCPQVFKVLVTKEM